MLMEIIVLQEVGFNKLPSLKLPDLTPTTTTTTDN